MDSYLNDHLAGSVSALELIEHWKDAHEDEPLGAFFSGAEADIRADQNKLRDVMPSLDIDESSVRKAGAWAAEKVGRARLLIAGDEPGGLGLVLSLEGLIMGITGKKLMWRSLAVASSPELSGYDFDDLQRRADQQIATLEAKRIEVARGAFASAGREH